MVKAHTHQLLGLNRNEMLSKHDSSLNKIITKSFKMVPQILLREIFSDPADKYLAATFVLAFSIFPVLALWDLDVTPSTIYHVTL